MKVREAWLRMAAELDTILWKMDYESYYEDPPAPELEERAREAHLRRRLRPGLMWPGIDF
jgi:hypothetical protein